MHKLFAALKHKVLPSRRRLATLSVGLLLTVLGFRVLFGANGLFAYQQKRRESRALEDQIRLLEQRNQGLEQQIKALKSDPQAIEKEARERLRYARPGEVIYTLPPPRPELDQNKK